MRLTNQELKDRIAYYKQSKKNVPHWVYDEMDRRGLTSVKTLKAQYPGQRFGAASKGRVLTADELEQRKKDLGNRAGGER